MHRFNIAACLFLLLTLLTGCASDNQVRSLAEGAHADLKPAVITDPELAGYIQEVGMRVVEAARQMSAAGYGPPAHTDADDNAWMFQNARFHLVNSPTLNAFTTGGVHMYIYTELLLASKTEDELAAVVAHEFAHIYGRHVHKGIDRQMAIAGVGIGASVAGAVASDNQYAGLLAGLAGSSAAVVGMGYGRNDEREADALGFDFFVRAGWDPNQFAGFFQTMIDKGLDGGASLTSSHPALSERVATAKKRAANLPASAAQWRRPPVADAARFAQIKARIREVAKSMPPDKSLEKARLMLASFSSCVSPENSQPEQVKVRELLYQQK